MKMAEANMKTISLYLGDEGNEIARTAQDICPGRPSFAPIRALALIIATIFEKSHWAHSGIAFGVDDNGHHYFRAGGEYIRIDGYKRARQVKLCLDLLEKQGYFS